jgi:hypothetical protein
VDYGEHAGRGFEGQTAEDVIIPLIAILQPLSPQVSEKTVPGAEVGMLYNTVTQELHTELAFVPACAQRLAVEWVPRVRGGGFVAPHTIDSEIFSRSRAESKKLGGKFGKYSTSYSATGERTGNDLVDTYYVYCVPFIGDEPQAAAVIPFASTKITSWRAINTRMLQLTQRSSDGHKVNPPMYAHRLVLSTVKNENAQGVWWNAVLRGINDNDLSRGLLSPDHPVFKTALALKQLVESGKGRAAYETEGTTDEAGSGGPVRADGTPVF